MRTPIEIEKAGAKVIISGAYSLLDTSFGLQVKFDGVHHLEITVPGEYFNKVRSNSTFAPLLFFSKKLLLIWGQIAKDKMLDSYIYLLAFNSILIQFN